MASAPRITWRLFDAEGKRISTAVTLQDGTLFQVFPRHHHMKDQDEWKALHPTWTEMKDEAAATPISAEQKKKNKKAKRWAALEAEPPHVKQVRAIYDEYCIPDSLAFKTNKCIGPLLCYVKLGNMLKPVIFNRKRSVFRISGDAKLMTEFPSEPLGFFVKVRSDIMEVPVPAPLPMDKKTIILYRHKNSHSKDYDPYSAWATYSDEANFARQKALAESEGFHVKVIRPLGYSTSGFDMKKTMWMVHPQVQNIEVVVPEYIRR